MSRISEQATANIREIPEHGRPISEQFRIVAKEWVELDAAANLLEELKTTTLEQRKSDVIRQQGDMADNKAERIVKSSKEWEQYIRDMVEARKQANLAKVKMSWIDKREREQQSYEATARSERRMLRTTP